MAKAKKSLSLLLLLSILISTICTSTAFAATDTFQSDTNANFNLIQGKTYTFKLTPSNPNSVIVVSTGSSWYLPIISTKKSGNSYYATIKTKGTEGNSIGIYASLKGQSPIRLFVVTITADTPPTSNISKPVDMTIYATPENNYNIVESSDDDLYVNKVGVFRPFVNEFDPTAPFSDLIYALNKNFPPSNKDDVYLRYSNNSEYTHPEDTSEWADYDYHSGHYANETLPGEIIYDKENQKVSINLNYWRDSLADSNPHILNEFLSSFCYFANDKEAGLALFAWRDATNTGHGSNKVTDYGFDIVKDKSKDSQTVWDLRYRTTGTPITYYHFQGHSSFEFYLNNDK